MPRLPVPRSHLSTKSCAPGSPGHAWVPARCVLFSIYRQRRGRFITAPSLVVSLKTVQEVLVIREILQNYLPDLQS